ncbi:actin family protein [Pseudomonas viridiflava]|uniref:actin family protein n=1 Tax=Pseudomonas viridiflava TaxID=33069 RepID=UPI0018E6068A|nr:actin family protein [Pseudomonas viridiflava]MBI6703574.1 hypothetical protein [Pseudomonas viridiflava]MBI6724818.1 hypothetical protein [Pseudomonas viridiflava]
MDDEINGKAVVIDMGSAITKIGFVGEKTPRAMIPTVIGKPKSGANQTTVYVGEEALTKRESLNLNYPVVFGIVTNWDDFEKVIHHAFHDILKISPEDHPILLTEPPLNPKANRERMTQIMFESFDCPAFYTSINAVLSLYATRTTTGVVLDVGDSVICAAPIYEGYLLPHATLKLNTGGRHLTEALAERLSKSSLDSIALNERTSVARYFKERLSCAALTADRVAQTGVGLFEKTYSLPGHEDIFVAKDFHCAEALFRPSLAGEGSGGIQNLIHQSITKCDADIQKDLWSNIVLSGGSAAFEKLGNRLQTELSALAPTTTEVKVTAPIECTYLSWFGGSVLIDQSTFQQMWITRQEYDENGPSIVYRKCF